MPKKVCSLGWKIGSGALTRLYVATNAERVTIVHMKLDSLFGFRAFR